MNKEKKALVLAGGLPQIALIEELKRRGYKTILADYNENPVAKKHADLFYQESTLDVDAIRKIAIKEDIDLIITVCTDQALATVSLLAQELNLPCYISADSGSNVTNKAKMKSIFERNAISTSKYRAVSAYEQCEDIKYPAVVKPADCNSSKGVVKVHCSSELRSAVLQAIQFSRTNTAIVEEYIEGREISVDLFVQNGRAKVLCVSENDKIKDDKRFVIYRGYYPADITDEIYNKIVETAQKIVTAFNLKNCPMLMQAMIKDNDIYVLEFSARTGGCIKHHLIELVSGIDVIKATVDLFEGKQAEICPTYSRKTIVNEFIYCKKGTFDYLSGFDECAKQGLLEGVFLLKNSGTNLEKVESSGDRIAAITYVADSHDDYVKKHNEVISRIKVIAKDGTDILRHDLFPEIKCDER